MRPNTSPAGKQRTVRPIAPDHFITDGPKGKMKPLSAELAQRLIEELLDGAGLVGKPAEADIEISETDPEPDEDIRLLGLIHGDVEKLCELVKGLACSGQYHSDLRLMNAAAKALGRRIQKLIDHAEGEE